MFPVLQIRRPVLAAVYFGLYFGGCIAMFGAVRGAPLGDILFEVAVSVITASVVGAVVNKRTRPELSAGLTTDQVRRVVRWVRRGEIVDDRAVAESVIVYARNQERSEPWGSACLAVMSVSAYSLTVAGPIGIGSTLLGVGVIGACAVFVIELRRARRRRRAAEATARSLLGEP